MAAWFATIAVIALLIAFNLYAVDTILKVRSDVQTIRKNVASLVAAVKKEKDKVDKAPDGLLGKAAAAVQKVAADLSASPDPTAPPDPSPTK